VLAQERLARHAAVVDDLAREEFLQQHEVSAARVPGAHLATIAKANNEDQRGGLHFGTALAAQLGLIEHDAMRRKALAMARSAGSSTAIKDDCGPRS